MIQKAKKEIVLIDGYVDIGTLNLLAKKNENVAIVMYTLKRTKLSQEDVNNFNSQYPLLEVRYTKVFHDRFLILDKKNAYHIGAFLKDAGKKCFGITLIEDDGIVRDILQRLEIETEEGIGQPTTENAKTPGNAIFPGVSYAQTGDIIGIIQSYLHKKNCFILSTFLLLWKHLASLYSLIRWLVHHKLKSAYLMQVHMQ